MKKLPLTRGMFALVDNDVYKWASKLNWCAQGTGDGQFYAVRRVDNKISLLHREILQAPANRHVDHKNHDTLDCRRQNMRLATRSQNGANQRKQKGTSSKYKGVCKVSLRVNKTNRWLSYIGSGVARRYLGYFFTESQAASAYNVAARKRFGAFAHFNSI